MACIDYWKHHYPISKLVLSTAVQKLPTAYRNSGMFWRNFLNCTASDGFVVQRISKLDTGLRMLSHCIRDGHDYLWW